MLKLNNLARKKKRVFVTTLLLVVLFISFFTWKVFAAAPAPEYGLEFYPYTKSNSYQLTGDLTPSGPDRPELNGAIRPALGLWLDVRFKDIINNKWEPATPNGNYLATIHFNIQETQASDDFNAREGYHLVPYQDIGLVAGWAGGNPTYIKNKVDEFGVGNEANYFLHESNYYWVGARNIMRPTQNLWFRFPSIVGLSGGGIELENQVAQRPTTSIDRGVTFPTFKATYYTTPWPKIYAAYGSDNGVQREVVDAKNGKFRLSTTTFSYNSNKHKIWILKGKHSSQSVLNQINATTAKSGKDDARRFNGYAESVYKTFDTQNKRTFNFNGTLPITDLSSIMTADGKAHDFTLVVSDGYDRINVSNFKLGVYEQDLGCDCSSVTIDPIAPQPVGTEATVSVKVTNHSNVDISETYLIWRWNTSGSTIQKVPIKNFKANETRTISFSVKYPDRSALLILNLNGYKDSPTNESSWANNRCEIKIGSGEVNLKAMDMRINPTKPQSGKEVKVDVLVYNESYTETIVNTYLDWEVNGSKQIRPANFTLAPREQKWITDLTISSVPEGNRLSIKAEINSGHDRPANELRADGGNPWQDNIIKREYALNEKTLNWYLASVSGATAGQNQFVTTRIQVGRENLPDDQKEAKTAVVRLYAMDANSNERLLVTQNVTVAMPGEKSTVFVSWNTGDMAIGDYTLIATVNLPPTQAERTYADNSLTSSLKIIGGTSNTYCGIEITSAISGFYTDGFTTVYYYEYFNANLTNGVSGTFVEESADEINGIDVPLVRTGSTTVKAGQGFNFEVDARYWEDRDLTGSVNRAVAHFPQPDGTVLDIDLVKIASSRNNAKWGLPTAWVAKHGDEVIYREGSNPGSKDPTADNYYYPGGRAYYTSLESESGTYNFTIDLYATGVNNLNKCLYVSVNIDGTLMDDFYVRQIIPESPFPVELFPAGPTSIWRNDVGQLQGLTDWTNFANGTKNWPN
ncbi:hypothetical protein [Paenibacillus sp. Leaf72]|uniref:hypothetical protein n=1 Tax=Paenibacillus sp. Leaf72 TaxID=1736234 RepID=UPI0006F1E969|nr:hypothetical protein [Paenibacillus sp. Leaf72]KQN97028.1 hypothetical protein ASF12_23450 [Paenibacillus sp. Leaf72]